MPSFIRQFLFLFVLIVTSCASVKTPESGLLRGISWKTEQVAPGVVWKYYHFDTLFNSKQSVTVLEIDSRKADIRMDYVETGLFLTSEVAEKAGAAVAVNGTFFNTRTGGSVVFVQDKGKRVPQAEGKHHQDAALEITATGEWNIIKRPEQGWDVYTSTSTVMSGGPLLVYDGEVVPQAEIPFNKNRHPRTAIGLSGNKLIAVVVDGRNTNAHGMSTPELARLMSALGCSSAVNFDGGGSSTAWVRGQGVVNYPCDNKQWDHAGERSVATALLVFEK